MKMQSKGSISFSQLKKNIPQGTTTESNECAVSNRLSPNAFPHPAGWHEAWEETHTMDSELERRWSTSHGSLVKNYLSYLTATTVMTAFLLKCRSCLYTTYSFHIVPFCEDLVLAFCHHEKNMFK